MAIQSRSPRNHRSASTRLDAPRILCVVLLSLPNATECASITHGQSAILCVSRVGDDALTMRVEASLQERIRKSAEFVLGDCNSGGHISVVLRHVDWRERDSRIEAMPAVEVNGGPIVGPITIRARCWDDDLTACSDVFVMQMKRALSKR